MRTVAPLLLLIASVCHCGGPTSGYVSSSSQASSGSAPAALRGINIDPRHAPPETPDQDDNPSVDVMKSVGGTSARFTFKAPNGLDEAFSFYDPILDGYRAKDPSFRVSLTLTSESLAGADVNRPTPTELAPGYTEKFAARAADIARHYKGNDMVEAFEIWNEEDDNYKAEGHFGPGDARQLEPSVYADLLNRSYDAIKATGTHAKVVVGGLDSGVDSYVDRMGDFRADAIATHPYGQWPGESASDGPSGEAWFNALHNHVDQYARFGRDIWFTEWNASNERLAAQYIQAFFADPTLSRVSRAFIFAWSDNQQSHDVGLFGLTRDDGKTKKDAWYAFAAASGVGADHGGGDDNNGGNGGGGNNNGGGGGNNAMDVFNTIVVNELLDAGGYITECTSDGKSQLVWQTTDQGPDGGRRNAAPAYPQSIQGSCGDAQSGRYPLVFTSMPGDSLGGVYATECFASNARHVFRVDAQVDGHPAAVFVYDESSSECQ